MAVTPMSASSEATSHVIAVSPSIFIAACENDFIRRFTGCFWLACWSDSKLNKEPYMQCISRLPVPFGGLVSVAAETFPESVALVRISSHFESGAITGLLPRVLSEGSCWPVRTPFPVKKRAPRKRERAMCSPGRSTPAISSRRSTTSSTRMSICWLGPPCRSLSTSPLCSLIKPNSTINSSATNRLRDTGAEASSYVSEWRCSCWNTSTFVTIRRATSSTRLTNCCEYLIVPTKAL
mmetsp:Transcript_48675/g.104827  ORF Transcript_48675/g.104827 Transcript_48675/m.104827 type:complete len:237 (+) Transcript_48675:4897-5607(+)